MPSPRSPLTAFLLVAVVVAGCATSTPSAGPSHEATTPAAGSHGPSPTAPSPSTEEPSSDPSPATLPTPEPLVIGGVWLKPKDGATLTSSAVTLSARTTTSGEGETTIDKVVFSASWNGAAKTVMCKATRPTDAGAWTCRANLRALGVPPGKVTFAFDVFPVGVAIARSPDGARRVTYAVAPPKPSDPHWRLVATREARNGTLTETYRLRWSAPDGYADEFLVYDTWECPRSSTAKPGSPCFVPGTPVDASMLKLLAKAPGDARSVRVELPGYECGPSYSTILLRARNAYGRSAFAIVESAPVPDPHDIIC